VVNNTLPGISKVLHEIDPSYPEYTMKDAENTTAQINYIKHELKEAGTSSSAPEGAQKINEISKIAQETLNKRQQAKELVTSNNPPVRNAFVKVQVNAPKNIK
jgi:hypothetical protein